MDPARRTTIHEAMVRFADGDRTAIQTLLDELWPVLLAFAQRGVQNPHDAEDVAQEVFTRICSRIADFDRTRDGLSWAFGIAGYEVLTHRRRVQRRRETSDAELYSGADPRVLQDDALMQEELLAALAQAVGELTYDDRAMLGMAVADAAPANVQGATLRKRRQRALERLRAAFRSVYGEP